MKVHNRSPTEKALHKNEQCRHMLILRGHIASVEPAQRAGAMPRSIITP